jgi:hypothetical protein
LRDDSKSARSPSRGTGNHALLDAITPLRRQNADSTDLNRPELTANTARKPYSSPTVKYAG